MNADSGVRRPPGHPTGLDEHIDHDRLAGTMTTTTRGTDGGLTT
jgi:hypothetical protein